MIVVRSLDQLRESIPDARFAVTIGNFDGVHLGHRELIRVTRDCARQLGCRTLALTFEPHPLEVLRGSSLPRIASPERKLEMLGGTGLDATLVLPFTTGLAATDPADFVRRLVREAGLAALVAGTDFALGKDRAGTLRILEILARDEAFSLLIVPPFCMDGVRVSSSRVRQCITRGDVHAAAELLGRPHSFDGTVVHGKALGRLLGYPTANLAGENVLLPPGGAYATWLSVLDQESGDAPALGSMTSVGTNPTFGQNRLSVETHIFDFVGDIYNKRVRVHFVRKLRDQVAFSGPEALAAQLAVDEAAARLALAAGEPWTAP